MGLDMFLTAKIYNKQALDANGNFCFPKVTINSCKNHLIEGVKEVPPKTFDNVSALVLDVAYWRKANAIHKWFVDNAQDGVDDCRTYYVSVEQLNELRSLCQRVLDNHDLAPTLLPTQEGFFFGDTNYDDNYFEDLQYTVDVLSELSPGLQYYYLASW